MKRKNVLAKLLASALFWSFSLPAFASFGISTNWDVKSSTGSDSNGGGFDLEALPVGTDESTGSGTAITVALTGATTGTGSPAFTGTTHGPGNFIHIASGTGCTVGWYEVLNVSAGTATFDHAMGSTSDNCVGIIGGSLATLAQANTNMVAGNTAWCTGTFTFTSVLTFLQATEAWVGYGSTHGDGGMCTWQTSTSSIYLTSAGSLNGGVLSFENLTYLNTATTPESAIYQPGSHGTTQTWMFTNVKMTGFHFAIDSSDGVGFDVAWIDVINSDFESNLVAIIQNESTLTTAVGSRFNANGEDILSGNGTALLVGNTFSNTAGGYGNSWSVSLGAGNQYFLNNSWCNTVSAAVEMGGASTSFFQNNAFYGMGGGQSAIAGQSTTVPMFGIVSTMSNHNAFQSGVPLSGYTLTPTDKTLTANPFVSCSTGNMAPNATAGGGLLLTGTGAPSSLGSSTTNSVNIGAVQAAASGGSGKVVVTGAIH